ncbi:hypothetical protein [Nitrospira sp. BLG_1]|uniref:hypothetical protein n=1 Tax=Nitrospira sp. BLG_1 TaxID=3395883 RepID=UPI0039BCE50E
MNWSLRATEWEIWCQHRWVPAQRAHLQSAQRVETLALPGDLPEARPKRLRFRVFNTVGKVVQHARCTLVRLTTVAQLALVDWLDTTS